MQTQPQERSAEDQFAYDEGYRDALIGVALMIRQTKMIDLDFIDFVLRTRPDGALCPPAQAVKLPE